MLKRNVYTQLIPDYTSIDWEQTIRDLLKKHIGRENVCIQIPNIPKLDLVNKTTPYLSRYGISISPFLSDDVSGFQVLFYSRNFEEGKKLQSQT